MRPLIKAILNSYAEILFMQGLSVGICMLIVTFISPRLAIAGLISVVAAYSFALLVGLNKKFLQSGYYTYNPLLVGMSLGSILSLTSSTVIYISISGVMTLLVSVLCGNIFHLYFNLPPLSIPFVICASISRLAVLRYPELIITTDQYWLELPRIPVPIILLGFCKSLGAILFLPEFLVGISLAAVIAFNSRILLFLGIMGYITGTSFRILLTGSYSQIYNDAANFNFILIAAAVGGVFLMPGMMSFILAMISVVVAALVMDAVNAILSAMNMPVYTLPFNFISLAVLYVVSVSENNFRPAKFGETPEKTLDYSLFSRWRSPIHGCTLSLPFYGSWTVWQAFDDVWTHKGNWKYAYDFVIKNDEGSSHEGTGEQLAEYYCFRKPVLSPVRGRVIQLEDRLPDNPIGNVDKINNWGNYIIIEDWRGYFVELSHFAQQSMKVKIGDWVEVGTVLGLCGNSGYSPQPHLHVQVQGAAPLGSYTIPFKFVNYVTGSEFVTCGLPEKDLNVETLVHDTGLNAKTDFILDEVYEYQVSYKDKGIGKRIYQVKMAVDGCFYFESEQGVKLYFGKHSGAFHLYQHECVNGEDKALVIALSQIPLSNKPGLKWKHYMPATLFERTGMKLSLLHLSAWVYPESLKVVIKSQNTNLHRSEFEASGPGSSYKYRGAIEFGDIKGFSLIESGDFTYRRINHV